MHTTRIGLIAGAGEVPVYFARKASQLGIKLVSIGFSKEIQNSLAPFSEECYSIGVGQPGKIFKTLHQNSVKDLLILGKVDKSIIFKLQKFDFKALQFFKNIATHEDKVLLLGVIAELEKEGFKVLSQKEFLSDIFPQKGNLTRREPTKQELEDIEFGLPIARKLADMEIGQTLVVKNKTVVAVEALEGTDRAIQRGCDLAQGKCVVIKVSRTNQDYRYDSPGIGPQTISMLAQGGVLALEAERVMVVEQEKVLDLANDAKIAVICV
ncbi:MAG: UDP-2,3-diacylglucosamine diphosphatase LpxI [Nitrospina sp.]|jgi:UDP-2,3-diacylglucosamine hydrolase|nr:UDP-2,3-diacylglucosamine diphosphatase LpxI [Nitrospina sp.]MBT3413790.1 UDP-2,3-diacylglucosamine diphosphatase LpxI [Nitrospina sp.]MBT3857755.1 UDP-2,3-diacylglucosamine diphosphatase LpxI [Nitrospina sp.]MBT4105440.1 UDP-2,3-diacylglucosamine diphosphatase LpxI [Nitrospina sp.]MBT4389995.1 UDP-2,3-diacylglucosamine diphosphatase LpxI [Nitrospina sp.]